MSRRLGEGSFPELVTAVRSVAGRPEFAAAAGIAWDLPSPAHQGEWLERRPFPASELPTALAAQLEALAPEDRAAFLAAVERRLQGADLYANWLVD